MNDAKIEKALLECCSPVGTKTVGRMRVRIVTFGDGDNYVISFQMYPFSKQTAFTFDLARAVKLFDKIDQIILGNARMTTQGPQRQPHARLTGTINTEPVMVDIYLFPTNPEI